MEVLGRTPHGPGSLSPALHSDLRGGPARLGVPLTSRGSCHCQTQRDESGLPNSPPQLVRGPCKVTATPAGTEPQGTLVSTAREHQPRVAAVPGPGHSGALPRVASVPRGLRSLLRGAVSVPAAAALPPPPGPCPSLPTSGCPGLNGDPEHQDAGRRGRGKLSPFCASVPRWAQRISCSHSRRGLSAHGSPARYTRSHAPGGAHSAAGRGPGLRRSRRIGRRRGEALRLVHTATRLVLRRAASSLLRPPGLQDNNVLQVYKGTLRARGQLEAVCEEEGEQGRQGHPPTQGPLWGQVGAGCTPGRLVSFTSVYLLGTALPTGREASPRRHSAETTCGDRSGVPGLLLLCLSARRRGAHTHRPLLTFSFLPQKSKLVCISRIAALKVPHFEREEGAWARASLVPGASREPRCLLSPPDEFQPQEDCPRSSPSLLQAASSPTARTTCRTKLFRAGFGDGN